MRTLQVTTAFVLMHRGVRLPGGSYSKEFQMVLSGQVELWVRASCSRNKRLNIKHNRVGDLHRFQIRGGGRFIALL